MYHQNGNSARMSKTAVVSLSRDDLVLELAVRVHCKYIVTYNKLDFEGVTEFWVQTVTAKEYLKIIEGLPLVH